MSTPSFSSHQKAGMMLVLVVGILGILFGFRFFRANIQRPFDEQLADDKGPFFLESDGQEQAEKDRQKTTDTDQDGLNDYDELYVYKTSAYLFDSDSDGFDDGTEVKTGNDPTCPSGQVCSGSTALSSDTIPVSEAEAISQSLSTAFRLQETNLQSPEDLQSFFASLTAQEVRSLLASQGVPIQTLEKFSDEQLMQFFQQAMEEAQASVSSEPPVADQDVSSGEGVPSMSP